MRMGVWMCRHMTLRISAMSIFLSVPVPRVCFCVVPHVYPAISLPFCLLYNLHIHAERDRSGFVLSLVHRDGVVS